MKIGKEKKQLLKDKFLTMYKSNKTISQISQETNYSRKFVTSCLIDVLEKNKTLTKVYKRKDNHQMSIHIPDKFLEAIGICKDRNIIEKVEIELDESNKQIIIKKHK